MGRIVVISSGAGKRSVADLIPSDYVAMAIRGEKPYNDGAALVDELRDYFLQEPYDEMTNEEILDEFDSLPRRRSSGLSGMMLGIAMMNSFPFDEMREIDRMIDNISSSAKSRNVRPPKNPRYQDKKHHSRKPYDKRPYRRR